MRTSKEQIINTVKAFDQELRDAQNYTNPDLNDEGIQRHRERMSEQVRAKYAKAVDEHRSEIGRAHV